MNFADLIRSEIMDEKLIVISQIYDLLEKDGFKRYYSSDESSLFRLPVPSKNLGVFVTVNDKDIKMICKDVVDVVIYDVIPLQSVDVDKLMDLFISQYEQFKAKVVGATKTVKIIIDYNERF